MQVTTAPVRNAVGEVTGGVEMFRDVSSMQVDLQKANQRNPGALDWIVPMSQVWRLSKCYIPFVELLHLVISEVRHIL